jgi:hypothetical protein
MADTNFVRHDNSQAVLNTDLEAYKAAKLRRNKAVEEKSLLERLNTRVIKLEECVQSLKAKIEKMEQK